MEDDEPYDLMPHKQIAELKKQVQELKANIDRVSPEELINSMDSLTKSIDAMLKLFTQAVEEMKYGEKEEVFAGKNNLINTKLDKILEQNQIVAEGIVTISDMIKDIGGKPKPVPRQNMPQQQIPQPAFNPGPNFQPSFSPPTNLQQFGPQFDEPPRPKYDGPVAMPVAPFPSLGNPKKKGLFGRLKK